MFGHRTIGSTFRTVAVGALALTALAAGEARAEGFGQPARPGFVLVGNGQPFGEGAPEASARTAALFDETDQDDDGAAMEADETPDLQAAQWGPPHGNAWGHPRHRGWGPPPRHWGAPPPRHWGPPRHVAPRCRTVWERRYDPWRGWSSYPVRRCW